MFYSVKIKYYLTIALILYSFHGHTQLPELNEFQKCKAAIFNEKKATKKMRIERPDKNKVSIMFFQDFSDTVSVYFDSTLLFQKYLLHDTLLVSTDYTGESLSHLFTKKNNSILILYHTQKKYLQFNLERRFPLYSVHHYLNKFCAISGRKSRIVIK